MANIKSSKKRAVQSEKKRLVNKMRLNSIRSSLRKVNDSIQTGDKKQAQEAFKVMQSHLMRGGAKGIFHANTVSRKLSRISKKIKTLAEQEN